MKKNFLTIVGALAGMTLLVACGTEKDETPDINMGEVRFSATMGGNETVTKAAGTDWAADDAIGIFMLENGTSNIAEGALNKKQVTSAGNGSFAPENGHAVYFPHNGSAVDFIAYYPYNTGVTATDGTIALDVSDQSRQPAFDLLRATANNSGAGYTKSGNPTVPLVFNHLLSKIVMNCVAGDGVPSLAGMTARINGMPTQATFTPFTGALSNTAGSAGSFAPRATTTAQYDAIILPTGYSAGVLTVDFTIGSETFVWDVGTTAFDPGYEYIFEVTIRRTGVTATGTINPWTTINRGGVTAE